MQNPRLSMCVLVLLFGAAEAANAAEWKSKAHQIAIDIPDDWEVINVPDGLATIEGEAAPEVLLMVANADLSFVIAVTARRLPGEHVRLNEKFATGFERGALKSAGRSSPNAAVTARKRIMVAGVPAYESIVTGDSDNGQMMFLSRFLLANEHCYSLGAFGLGRDVTNDEVVQRALASFRFLTPPRLPPADGSVSSAEGFAEKMGELAAYCLMGAAALWVLRRLFRGRKASPTDGE